MTHNDLQDPAARASRQNPWRELIKTIAFALLIAGGIRTAAAQPFNIPSGSMYGTLLIGDYLFVAKPSYGYSRYSLPWGYLWPLPPGRVFASQPERGDVVVFKTPQDNRTDFIKRLIGLPGDRIQMRAGVLHINDAPIPKKLIDPFVEYVGGARLEYAQYQEALPNGVTYTVLDRGQYSHLDDTDVYVVPEGHYFMMGDNRDDSLDSRVNVESGGVGYVPFENLVGKAEIVFFSIDGNARFWEVWKWPFAIRFDRIGQIIG